MSTTAVTTAVTRAEVEDLLFLEAELLDDWKLEQWLALYTDDATYSVPSTDLPADANPDKSLFYIADDRVRLQERVIRLMKKSAHAEQPRSRTRHLVSNVRVGALDGDPLSASAAFVTYRTKNGHTDVYIGSLRYRLHREGDTLRIRDKRCVLDLDGLRPHGRISIIL
jgi:p-cumate 2,3-dioxygenase subunit beta